jgi:hypothetical protein
VDNVSSAHWMFAPELTRDRFSHLALDDRRDDSAIGVAYDVFVFAFHSDLPSGASAQNALDAKLARSRTLPCGILGNPAQATGRPSARCSVSAFAACVRSRPIGALRRVPDAVLPPRGATECLVSRAYYRRSKNDKKPELRELVEEREAPEVFRLFRANCKIRPSRWC